MKNGFIIVNYNDSKTVLKLIDNIKNYNIIDKIVIVDNCSTDDSLNQLKKITNEKIQILSNNSNNGYGPGINLGAKYLKKLYNECNLIISNADIIIHSEDDLVKLISELNSHKDTAIVAPVIEEKEGLNRGWKIPTPLQDAALNLLFIHKFLRPKLLFYKDEFYKDTVQVDTVSGCFFLMKSTILEKIDYFDEQVFLYYEENIIAAKLKQINKKVLLNTTISVFHNHAITIDKNINRINKFKILKKSQMYFQIKYNKANIFEKFLLLITNKFSLLILYLTVHKKVYIKK
ncbi:MAG: glycosyltransferase [Bacilli bacterium]